jgi:ribonuclease VapC
MATIVVDTSAVVAILLAELDAQQYGECIWEADLALMSAASLVETDLVLTSRLGPKGSKALDRFLNEAGIQIEAVTPEQAGLAREAFARYGKGRNIRGGARLNFGDCFSYALAKHLDAPLLYKGDDFAGTDVAPALR